MLVLLRSSVWDFRTVMFQLCLPLLYWFTGLAALLRRPADHINTRILHILVVRRKTSGILAVMVCRILMFMSKSFGHLLLSIHGNTSCCPLPQSFSLPLGHACPDFFGLQHLELSSNCRSLKQSKAQRTSTHPHVKACLSKALFLALPRSGRSPKIRVLTDTYAVWPGSSSGGQRSYS